MYQFTNFIHKSKSLNWVKMNDRKKDEGKKHEGIHETVHVVNVEDSPSHPKSEVGDRVSPKSTNQKHRTSEDGTMCEKPISPISNPVVLVRQVARLNDQRFLYITDSDEDVSSSESSVLSTEVGDVENGEQIEFTVRPLKRERTIYQQG